MSVFARVLGRRGLAVYLSTILVVSLAFGTLFQLLFADVHLPLSLHAGHEHGADAALGDVRWWASAAALLLGVLVLRALLVKARGWVRARGSGLASIEIPTAMRTVYLKVGGMTCNHCRGNVARAIRAVKGVSGMVVSLESGRATVQGDGVAVLSYAGADVWPRL